MPSLDIEQASQDVNPTRGFARVAAKINSDKDKTTKIYRRFDELSARNLICYQAELAELEEQLKELDDEDRNAKDTPSIECQSDWIAFVKAAYAGKEREKKKMELLMEIREMLEKYHAALAAHQALLNTVPPSKTTIKAMRNWFFNNTEGRKDGDGTPQLWGASEKIFDEPNDLVALHVPQGQDRLSNFIHSNMGIFFQTSNSKRDGRTTYMSSKAISLFVAVFQYHSSRGVAFRRDYIVILDDK